MSVSPGGGLHHSGQPVERRREDSLTAELVCKPVHALFSGDMIEIALFNIKLKLELACGFRYTLESLHLQKRSTPPRHHHPSQCQSLDLDTA